MAINTSHYLNDAILDMTGQNKKVAWWKLPFVFFLRNKGVYAFEVAGQCAFPLMDASMGYSNRLVVCLIKGSPSILNGGSFGSDELLHKDEGGAWKAVFINVYCTNPFEILDRLYTAFHELKAA